MSLSDRVNVSTAEKSYQSPMITIWCCPSLTDIQCRGWPTIKSVTLTLARLKDFATAVSPGNISPLLSFCLKNWRAKSRLPNSLIIPLDSNVDHNKMNRTKKNIKLGADNNNKVIKFTKLSRGSISINIFSAQIQFRIRITSHIFTEQKFFTLSAKIDTDLQRQNIIKYGLWWLNQRLNLLTNNANVEKTDLKEQFDPIQS